MSEQATGRRRWVVESAEPFFRLDVERIGLDPAFVESMQPRVERALDAMSQLEAGAIANPDEQRMVGHYWLRAPELAPSEEIAETIRDARGAVERFARDVRSGAIRPPGHERFERFLLIGIGGSALGPQLVDDALDRSADGLAATFLDNTDPDGFDRAFAAIDPARTLVVVVSKSGSTPETRNGMLEAMALYRKAGLDFGPHAVAVTGAGSALDTFATDREFIARFPMWDWVGGRTSVMSAVGLLPAALAGIDTDAFVAGAAAMDRLTREPNPRRNPATLLALAWYRAGDGAGRRDMVILPYKDRLALFSRYLQQLVMESLGKRLDLDGKEVHQGIAVYGNKGSTDQHAYVQQLREGVPNFFATFIQVLRDRDGTSPELEPGVTAGDFLLGFMLGTREALSEAGRPSLTIAIDDVTPHALGMLIALYERAVGLYASFVNVNAYHQPGVEAGKQAAARVLDLQRDVVRALHERGEAGGTAAQLAESVGAAERVETVALLLEHLATNPARGVARQPGSSPADAIFRVGPG